MITISTKGVFDTRTHAAAWAAQVSEGCASRIHRGPIQHQIRGSSEADMVAIDQGLRAVYDRLPKAEVLIVTNSRECIAVLIASIPGLHADGITPANLAKGSRLARSASVAAIRRVVEATQAKVTMDFGCPPEVVLATARSALRNEVNRMAVS